MKSEPETFSLSDLRRKGRSLWDGVRNFQARNFMQREMQIGDEVFFYHSSCAEPGIVGLARVSGPAVPDPTQFQKNSEYFEPRATKDKPLWFCVEVEFVRELPQPLTLKTLRATPELKDMLLLRPGQRLSIQPVTAEERKLILRLTGEPR